MLLCSGSKLILTSIKPVLQQSVAIESLFQLETTVKRRNSFLDDCYDRGSEFCWCQSDSLRRKFLDGPFFLFTVSGIRRQNFLVIFRVCQEISFSLTETGKANTGGTQGKDSTNARFGWFQFALEIVLSLVTVTPFHFFILFAEFHTLLSFV